MDYLRCQMRRGGGKTTFALNWVRAVAQSGAKHILLADKTRRQADMLRDELRRRDPQLFERIALQSAGTHGDEVQLRGSIYDAAVAENIDDWPTVYVDPDDLENVARFNPLFDEILRRTKGPLLWTYTDPEAILVRQIPHTK